MPMPSEAPPARMVSVIPAKLVEDARGEPEPGVSWRDIGHRLVPATGVVGLLIAWDLAVRISHSTILPTPYSSLKGLIGITTSGLVVKYIIASLFRVTWGYLAAVLLAVPMGLALGWYRRAELAANPILQMLRPISPLAWIPISILLFGVGDVSAIFIIFLGSFFPLVVAVMNSVSNVSMTHLNVGRNFGMSSYEILRHIVFPTVLPQMIVAMRVSLGVAWLVVVAAEMIAVNSGLGFLIIEARNAGNRYDLVLGGILLIGTIGVVLDALMRRLERTKMLAWSYAKNAPTESSRHVQRRRHAR